MGPIDPTMYTIAYVSTMVPSLGADDVDAIVGTSRHNNASLGVTGLLIRCGQRFLQVLEGDETVVTDLYARIASDPRHTDLRRVASVEVASRSYPDWTMGYESVSSATLATALLRPLVEADHIPHDLVAEVLLARFDAAHPVDA